MHNQALLSPLSRLGRLTLRSSRPKAYRYAHNSQLPHTLHTPKDFQT